MKTKILPLIGLTMLLVACQSKKKRDTPAVKVAATVELDQAPEVKRGKALLAKCLTAHGGMEQWNSFEGIEYNLNDNGKMVYQLTHLKDRRAYLKSGKYAVGFNGEVAWAIPDASEVSGKSAAFYYNLDFYFIGIPFLLKDPGVEVFYAGETQVRGQTYEALKISFGQGVGLTPEDIYYLYIDPETYLLHILTYSISYFDKENAKVNSAKVYSNYRKVQGLMMPHKMENFEWADGAIGESKNHLRLFNDIRFSKEISDEKIFEVPDGAVIEKTMN